MRQPLAMIVFLAALVAPALHALAQEKTQTAQSYAEQLAEYDRRVAQEREWEAERGRTWWVFPAITLAVLIAYLIYSQAAARKRVNDLVAASRMDVERAARQNEQIIELLKSIDDRLGRGG